MVFCLACRRFSGQDTGDNSRSFSVMFIILMINFFTLWLKIIMHTTPHHTTHYTRTCTYAYACALAQAHTHRHAFALAHAHMCTHTHTHTHIPVGRSLGYIIKSIWFELATGSFDLRLLVFTHVQFRSTFSLRDFTEYSVTSLQTFMFAHTFF